MISRDGNCWHVSGRLAMDTVAALVGVSAQFKGETRVVIDLTQVEAVDSAAVSLLIGWVREAQRSKVNLCFAHVPENLLSLARLYGVVDLLPLCHDHAVQA